MTLIYLMRHGETEWNEARKLQGQADIPLSERGKAQVAAQVGALPQSAVRAVASNLQRTSQTASLMGFRDVLTDPALREIDLGDWEGRRVDQLLAKDQDAYFAWRFGRFTPPGAEPWGDFCERIANALRRHAKRAALQNEDLVVFCHGGVIRAALDKLVGLPIQRLEAMRPAGVCVITSVTPATLVSYN